MSKLVKFLAPFLIALIISGISFGVIRASNPCRYSISGYTIPSLQIAVDIITDSGTIWISGDCAWDDFDEDGNMAAIVGKDINFNADTATIDAMHMGRIFAITDSHVSVRGLTVVNAQVDDTYETIGSAVRMVGNSSLDLVNANVVSNSGAAIFAFGQELGVYTDSIAITLTNSVLAFNDRGIFMDGGIIRGKNNIFHDNEFQGISTLGGPVFLTNTIFSEEGDYVLASAVGGGIRVDYNLWYNTCNTCFVMGIEDLILTGTHNFTGNPLFVDPYGLDFHIQAGSPAIDNGSSDSPKFDIDVENRPIGRGYDIGPDEFFYEEIELHMQYFPIIQR